MRGHAGALRGGEHATAHSEGDKSAIERLIKSGAVANFGQHSADTQADNSADTPWVLGASLIDGHLPDGGLSRRAVHEIEATCPRHAARATAFALGLIAQLQSSLPIIWCHTGMDVREGGHPFLAGLSRFGLSHERVIFANLARPSHLPFALEEALKTSGIAAVIGEGPRPDFTGSRRLSFLTQRYAVPCLLVSDGGDAPLGSAARTRWRIGPTLGPADPTDPKGPGQMAWRLGLARARGGRPSPHLPSAIPLGSQDTAHRDNSPIHNNPHNKNSSQTPLEWRLAWNDKTYSFTSLSMARGGKVYRGTTRPTARQPRAMVGRTAGQQN
ncbi:MAG: hypothetical protein AAGH82_02250 [Pseudomonadota bacterium]